MENLDLYFKEIVEKARNDPNIIGLYLSGSRGKGKQTKYSDYDVEIVVKDEVREEYEDKFKQKQKKGISFCIFSLTEFEKYADIGSEFEWDKPSFTFVKAIIDKNGKIQELIDNKGKIPDKNLNKYVSGYLDGYINYVYRSIKCYRDNNILGARLEAARSLNYFLIIIFGIDGRLTPYYKYLEWELKEHPLKKFKMSSKEIIQSILRILERGDIITQQKLFYSVEKVFKNAGYGRVFNNWDKEAIKLIKNFKLK